MIHHCKTPLFFTFDIDIVQYPLQHVTYTPAKFEVATSNSLGGAFTKCNKIHSLTLGPDLDTNHLTLSERRK